jgi:methyltransferase
VFETVDWSWLHVLIPLVIVQRLVELRHAKRNAAWLLSKGAIEHGAGHYPMIVAVHVLWFVAMLLEILFLGRDIVPLWPLLLALFMLAQFVRYWAIRTLGRRWNTRVYVLPKATPIATGPYRYLRHPNYIAVGVELVTLPLIYGAFVTAIAISILNVAVLRRRVAIEEAALGYAASDRSTNNQ